jgi:hypothetical protein
MRSVDTEYEFLFKGKSNLATLYDAYIKVNEHEILLSH